jgi:signal transduction histidine kinase
MSHELRTPLNHIIGFTEMVVDKKFGFLNEAQEEVLEDVLQSSKHLLSLINDILDLSKVEAGKLEYNPAPVDLKTLLENSLTMVKEKALKHRLVVTTDIENVPVSITADERKLKQIVYKLLSNAVKFTPDGGKIVVAGRCIETVETEAAEEGNRIQLSVSDTGIGLKAEDLQRIFEPFEQVENVARNTSEGTYVKSIWHPGSVGTYSRSFSWLPVP